MSSKCKICRKSIANVLAAGGSWVCEEHVAGPLKGGLGVNLGSDDAEQRLDSHLAADAAVNHPKHYNLGDIEVIDAIEDWRLGFHEANAVKYLARAKYKNDELEDLKKARWYINRRIEQLEKGERGLPSGR